MSLKEYTLAEVLSINRRVSSTYIEIATYRFMEINSEQKWWYCSDIQQLDDSLYNIVEYYQIRMVSLKEYTLAEVLCKNRRVSSAYIELATYRFMEINFVQKRCYGKVIQRLTMRRD